MKTVADARAALPKSIPRMSWSRTRVHVAGSPKSKRETSTDARAARPKSIPRMSWSPARVSKWPGMQNIGFHPKRASIYGSLTITQLLGRAIVLVVAFSTFFAPSRNISVSASRNLLAFQPPRPFQYRHKKNDEIATDAEITDLVRRFNRVIDNAEKRKRDDRTGVLGTYKTLFERIKTNIDWHVVNGFEDARLKSLSYHLKQRIMYITKRIEEKQRDAKKEREARQKACSCPVLEKAIICQTTFNVINELVPCEAYEKAVTDALTDNLGAVASILMTIEDIHGHNPAKMDRKVREARTICTRLKANMNNVLRKIRRGKWFR